MSASLYAAIAGTAADDNTKAADRSAVHTLFLLLICKILLSDLIWVFAILLYHYMIKKSKKQHIPQRGYVLFSHALQIVWSLSPKRV